MANDTRKTLVTRDEQEAFFSKLIRTCDEMEAIADAAAEAGDFTEARLCRMEVVTMTERILKYRVAFADVESPPPGPMKTAKDTLFS